MAVAGAAAAAAAAATAPPPLASRQQLQLFLQLLPLPPRRPRPPRSRSANWRPPLPALQLLLPVRREPREAGPGRAAGAARGARLALISKKGGFLLCKMTTSYFRKVKMPSEETRCDVK